MHDEERHQNRNDSEEDSWKQRRMLMPVVACQCEESDGERDTDHIVGDSSYRTFRAFLWRSCNIRMPKGSCWHG